MEMFGESGVDKTTIRQIASRAGVSPGLVIHHFGSKNGLREAVDDWIMEKINTEKGWFRSGGFQIQMDVSGDGERAAVMRYLIQMMRMDGPIATFNVNLSFASTCPMSRYPCSTSFSLPSGPYNIGKFCLLVRSAGTLKAFPSASTIC